MRTTNKVVFFLLLATLSSACSGEKNLTAQEVVAQFIPAMCKKIVLCKPDKVTEAACHEGMNQAFGADLQASQELQDALKMTNKELATCLSALEKIDCATLESTPPAECKFLRRQE